MPQVERPPLVERAAWGSRPEPMSDARRHVPAWITIHHAGVPWKPGADPADFVRRMQAWGQKRPMLEPPGKAVYWPDLPYHFMIAPDGRIFEGRPVDYEPESNTAYALKGNLGVELMGDFGTQRPSAAQLRSCVALTAWLCGTYRIDPAKVRGHKDVAPGQTTCPGPDFARYLEDGQFGAWVRATLRGEKPVIAPGPALPSGPTNPIDAP